MRKNVIIDFDTYYHNDADREKFYSAFRECAQVFGCNYMGYICEDLIRKVRIGFTTSPDWQREYIGKHLVDVCHLWNTVSQYFTETDAAHFILPWELIKPKTSLQKDIILYREEMNIGQNGISFCTRSPGIREYFYFAPDVKNVTFLKYIKENIALVKKYALLFREVSLQSIEENSLVQ